MAAVLLAAVLLAAGCGGGLSRAEVDEAVAEAVSGLSESGTGVTATEMEAAIRIAIEGLPAPQEPLTMAEVQQAIQDAIAAAESPEPDSGGEVPAPPKSDAAAYTKFAVDQAIALYEADGLDTALDRYSSPDSVDGQWYVFIVDSDGTVIAHPDEGRVGESLHGWVGTDINGYEFGPEMLAADETGRWVPYVYVNPTAGTLGDGSAFQLKNAWVRRHDGMLFGSGWYIDADEHTKSLVAVAVDKFRTAGLAGTIEYFASPQSATAGLEETIAYYNSADSIAGQWLAFIADTDGRIVAHLDPEMLGTSLQDLFGVAASRATAHGSWVTTDDIDPSTGGPESMRVWMVAHGGMAFGAGWYNAGTD